MSNVPEGAQMSDDGQYWWDEESGVWISVNVDGGWADSSQSGGDSGWAQGGDSGGESGWTEGEDSGGGSGEGDGGAKFAVTDLRIDPVAMGSPSANEELKAAFQVCNVGTAAGRAEVVIYVDGSDTGVTWKSESVPPNHCTGPGGDGYVAGIPGQSEGEHKFEIWVTPGEPGYDYTYNNRDIGRPES